jgi:hypothetical protein
MKEIQKLEVAIILLAKAIESGRITGVSEEVQEILGYTSEN